MEFVDVIRHTNPNKCIFKNVNKEIHKGLSKRDNTSKIGKEQIINHLANSIYSSYIKEVYKEVMLYFKNILGCIINKGVTDIKRFAQDKDITLSLEEFLGTKTRENVIAILTKKIFRKLENKKDTLFILTEIPKRININIPKEKIKETLPYFEIRHLLVHNDGKLDNFFKFKYPKFLIKTKVNYKMNFNLDFIIKLKNKIMKLIRLYDNELISDEFVHAATKKESAPDILSASL